ncbi:TPA: hypothetical protein ACS7XF_000765 [Providencia alcalifaciens]
MSVIKKPDLKIFAQDAKTGEIESFPDILRGWGITLERTAGKPPLEWFNAIGKRVDEWLMYLTQRGVAEWDASLSYPKTAIIQFNSIVYVSVKETKGEQPDKSQASWSTLGLFLGLDKYSTTAEMNLELNKKMDKANISGVKGNDNDKVPSLNLFTTEIGKLASIGYSYSKIESDGRYQPKGDYATSQALNDGLIKKFDKTGGTINGSVTTTGNITSNGDVIQVVNNKNNQSIQLDVTNDGVARINARTKGGATLNYLLPTKSGQIMLVDEFGIGSTASSKDANNIETTSFTASDHDSVNFFSLYAPAISMKRPGGSDGTGFLTQIQGDAGTRIAFRQRTASVWRGWYEFYTEANTSKDANGFLRTGNATALTTGNITQSTGSSTASVMSQKATSDAIAALKMMGDGQKWVNVTSERKLGVNYANTTGRAKAIFISSVESINSASITVYSDNVICSRNMVGGGTEIGFTRQCNGYAIIPAGSVYRVEGSSLKEWVELV